LNRFVPLLVLLLATPAIAGSPTDEAPEPPAHEAPWFGCHKDPIAAKRPARADSVQCLEGRVLVAARPGVMNQKTLDRLQDVLLDGELARIPRLRLDLADEHPRGQQIILRAREPKSGKVTNEGAVVARIGRSTAGVWLAVCVPRQRYEAVVRYTCEELLDNVRPSRAELLPEPPGTVEVVTMGSEDVRVPEGCRWFHLMLGATVLSCDESSMKLLHLVLDKLPAGAADAMRATFQKADQPTQPCTVLGHKTRCVREVELVEFFGITRASVFLSGEAFGQIIFVSVETTPETADDLLKSYGTWIALD